MKMRDHKTWRKLDEVIVQRVKKWETAYVHTKKKITLTICGYVVY